jgi:protein O-GlcNAcase/histone acetyltransferase
MTEHQPTDFLAGVIEGFYGQPWSQSERFALFEWMAAWGLNTYLYAAKDDLKHRTVWRETYSAAESEALAQVIHACKQRKIQFFYGLGPGLDIRYASDADLHHLKKRFEQMLALGCEHFALLFDDIPDRMNPEDSTRWDSFASAQCYVTNALFKWLRDQKAHSRLLFCPTPYCGRMAERKLGGDGYLSIIGRELLPEIDVFWTGPEIISREITVAHARQLQTILRRKPLIWDNLHANDYDGRRFFCGPYSGRPPEFRNEVSGLLTNPNTEFPLNYIPLRTLAEFVHCAGEWDPREAYLRAMKEWLPHFASVGQPVTLEDLTLFGDCYYLPHQEGPEAEALYQIAHRLITKRAHPDDLPSFQRTATRLREFCVRMTELRQRPLFYALSRRIWDLREELDLLERFVAYQSNSHNATTSFTSDFHLCGTYRGGMVARLQNLLDQQGDGSFAPHPSPTAKPS